MITIGIDNGQSGSVGVISDNAPPTFFPVPTKNYLHYGQKGSISQRLNRDELAYTLVTLVRLANATPRVYIERPFSGRFINAVVPAHRFFEATIIAMEDLKYGYEVVDSREWQKPVLGNVKTSAALKLASKLRGIQLYPQFTDQINKQGDADGLLICHHFHYAHRN